MNNLTNIPIISFPWGVGGNHVRWLLFLDKSMYNPYSDNQDIDAKMDFIEKNIYNETRTWNNWLEVEWKYRMKIEDQIKIDHELYDWKTNPDYKTRKILFLKPSDVDLAVTHYFHINLGMNSSVPSGLRQRMQHWNNELDVITVNQKKLDNWLILDAKTFEKCLDRGMYNTLINFFGFDDHYEQAKIVHDWYYASRQKSARDFYEYFTGSEFDTYMTFLKDFGYSND
jgi:hypothetical protein